jgi:CRP/FNR family transcriptional regulator, dissimilatory nitrate respiration regulator
MWVKLGPLGLGYSLGHAIDSLATPMSRGPAIKTQAFLANQPMFADMSAAELDRLAAFTAPVSLVKGASLFQCGDPCTGFHVMVYGQVKLGFMSPEGVEKVVEIMRAGQSFGEALMFLDQPYIVYAQALCDSMVLHVAKQAVVEGLATDPAFARRMLAGLSRRLHGLVRDVEAYSLRSSQQRVVGYLIAEVENGAGGACEVQLTPGKGTIASRLNMTPEHFSRILHDLCAAGLIDMNGRAIRIHDVARLRATN